MLIPCASVQCQSNFHACLNWSTECVTMVLETASDWVMVFRDDIDQSESRMIITSKGVMLRAGLGGEGKKVFS